MVCIATSLDAVPRLIRTVANVGYKGIVFDIASIKGHVMESIEHAREQGLSIASCHPMFGPDTRTLSDKVVCFCDTGDTAATQSVEALFRDTAATLMHLSFEEHDRTISSVLCLSHVINVILSEVLRESGLRVADLEKVASPTFSSQMTTLGSVITENPSLYYGIQTFNPQKEQLYQSIDRAVETVTATVLEGNETEFRKLMDRGRAWIGNTK